MYTLRTTDFFKRNGIDKRLIDIDIVKNISNDSFVSKFHYLYAVFLFNYKIEFSFNKEKKNQYIMIEENYYNDNASNNTIKFIDDISLFSKNRNIILNEFNIDFINDDMIKIRNVELYFSKNKLNSLYFFSNS